MKTEDRNTATKMFHFSLSTPAGKLPTLSIEVTDHPTLFAELVPLMQAVCDKVVEQACSVLKEEEQVSCSRGCGFCCRQVVPLSIPELLFLAEHIEKMELFRRERLYHRFRFAREKLDRDGIIGKLRTAVSDSEANKAAEAYFRYNIECPFLEDEVCSIHPVRPFACREFNAVTDPLLCRDPFRNKISRVPVAPKITTVMARFAGRILGEKPVLLPHILLTCNTTVQPRWTSAFPGISLFEKLLGCF